MSPDEQFLDELEIFRKDTEGATQFFCAYESIHDMAAKHERVLSLLSQTPLFSNTILAALQTAWIVTLGRVFDQDSAHNLDRLLRIAQKNPEIFSKLALAQRRISDRAEESEWPGWLNDFVQNAYEPAADDFRQLRKQVNGQRKIYELRYRGLRDKVYAHNATANSTESFALFVKVDTSELHRMFTFFGSLHEALWQLFFNGRKVLVSDSDDTLRDTVQESIARQAKQFLSAASSGTR